MDAPTRHHRHHPLGPKDVASSLRRWVVDEIADREGAADERFRVLMNGLPRVAAPRGFEARVVVNIGRAETSSGLLPRALMAVVRLAFIVLAVALTGYGAVALAPWVASQFVLLLNFTARGFVSVVQAADSGLGRLDNRRSCRTHDRVGRCCSGRDADVRGDRARGCGGVVWVAPPPEVREGDFEMVRWSALRTVIVALASIAASSMCVLPAEAQPEPTAEQLALRDAVVERFEVVPLTDGVALAPKDASTDVRLVQLQDGAIAIDGAIVSGQELRERIGDDADLVVRLSYLEPSVRMSLLGGDTTGDIDETPATTDPPAPPPLTRQTTSSGIVRIGGPVTVGMDERVRGDVIVLGGPLTIDGEVTGEVVVVGGSARFGPEAEVDGEVTVIGGPVDRARTASIRRGINEIGFGDIDFGDFEIGDWIGSGFPIGVGRGWGRGGWDLAGTVLRLIFLALIASIVVFAAQGSVERVASRTANEPLKAGLVGFLTQILLVPLFVLGVLILVVSIIGIPLLLLLPFAIIGVFVMMAVGFAGSAHALGRWLGHRLGRATQPIVLSVWIGIALMLIPTMAGEAFDLVGGPFGLVAVLFVATGAFIEYAVWTTGLGAIVLNRFGAPLPAGGAPATPVLPTPPGPDPETALGSS